MPEAVAVTLESGQSFGRWSEVEFAFGLDGYTAVSLTGPFDHERPEVRRAFQPLSFPRVTVTIGDRLVLTGYAKDIAPSSDAAMSSVGVTVYSLAHELTEVCVDPALLPLEFNGLDLRQISDRLVTPSIGERAIFDGEPGAPFARVRAEPDATIHSFLVDLALQRGFVLTDAPSGALAYRAAASPGAPVARLSGQPLTKVSATFDPPSWFATITGRASRKSGKSGSKYSEFNPLYRADHPRHYTARLDDTESGDVPRAVHAAVGRMVGGVVTYTIDDLPTWRDLRGALWQPNTTLTLVAPEAMVYRETELVVRSVRLHQTPDGETASLGLVLPGSFGGALPAGLPWDF
jgi:prophage tail gpP-like protein